MRRAMSVGSIVSCLALLAFAVGFGPSAFGGTRHDPQTAFCFRVTINSLGIDESTAYFRSVGGLKVETEVVDYQEGGGGPILKKAGALIPPRLVLRRDYVGQDPKDPMQKWFRDVVAGQDVRSDVAIVVLRVEKSTLVPVAKYEFHRCFPVKWELPDLDAEKTEGVLETFEIAVERLTTP